MQKTRRKITEEREWSAIEWMTSFERFSIEPPEEKTPNLILSDHFLIYRSERWEIIRETLISIVGRSSSGSFSSAMDSNLSSQTKWVYHQSSIGDLFASLHKSLSNLIDGQQYRFSLLRDSTVCRSGEARIFTITLVHSILQALRVYSSALALPKQRRVWGEEEEEAAFAEAAMSTPAKPGVERFDARKVKQQKDVFSSFTKVLC